MGRKSANNRLYMTQSEWEIEFGGRRQVKKDYTKSLPFDCCALSFQPFQDPVITPFNTIYDITNIIPFIKKHGIDPITGKPLTVTELTKLKFHKNKEGKYFCPVTYKEFNEFTHIVAVKPSGNVYSNEAVQQLNINAKNWKDLVDGTPFTRKDIVNIQDPLNPNKPKIGDFFHVKNNLVTAEGEEDDSTKNINATSSMLSKTLKEYKEAPPTILPPSVLLADLEKRRQEEREGPDKQRRVEEAEKKKQDAMAKAKSKEKTKEKSRYVESASFTCAGFTAREEDTYMQAKETNKRAYCSIVTNLGTLNFELRSDKAPLTCENFLALCESGYYNNTIFHRSIRNFMIQGGDPTGTGSGGQSIWKKKFKDEFHRELHHSERGILSMANAGKDTNGSQFFILFGPAKHLNQKHSVFGKLVGGYEVLAKMEHIPTDENDRPLIEIKIVDTPVYFNPFSEEEQEKEKQEKLEASRQKQMAESGDPTVIEGERGQWFSAPQAAVGSGGSGVGKYLPVAKKGGRSDIASTSTSTSTSSSSTSTATARTAAPPAGPKGRPSLLAKLPAPAKRERDVVVSEYGASAGKRLRPGTALTDFSAW